MREVWARWALRRAERSPTEREGNWSFRKGDWSDWSADALTSLPAAEFPNLQRLRTEGARTLNARCDYRNALPRIDTGLGVLFRPIDSAPALTGHTAIVLTADHGGSEENHADPSLSTNYTIPFFVWGPGVAAGADLYALNSASRTTTPSHGPTHQVAGNHGAGKGVAGPSVPTPLSPHVP